MRGERGRGGGGLPTAIDGLSTVSGDGIGSFAPGSVPRRCRCLVVRDQPTKANHSYVACRPPCNPTRTSLSRCTTFIHTYLLRHHVAGFRPTNAFVSFRRGRDPAIPDPWSGPVSF
jgi:hypothetical protein